MTHRGSIIVKQLMSKFFELRRFLQRKLPPSVLKVIKWLLYPKYRMLLKIERQLADRCHLKVQSGPFVGLKYVRHAVGSALAPKLVGCYEAELHDIVRHVINADYELLIDIGAAEGYFACGFAKAGLKNVIAFETTASGRQLIKRLAELNNVSTQVKILGLCTPELLKKSLVPEKHTFVLCDCEGGELELLNPAEIPELLYVDILVEVHGRVEVPKGAYRNHPEAMCGLLQSRFQNSHKLRVIDVSERTLATWPKSVDFVPESERILAMNEYRSEGPGWLWMKSNHLDRSCLLKQ